MNQFAKILKILLEIFFVIISFYIVLAVAYYFTWTLLIGPMSWGSDFTFIASLVKYLDRWYPPVPNWNYTSAGGMPFLPPYPPLPTLLTFLYHQITDWSIIKSMRFLAWFSVPMAAWGIAVLGRLLTKNWLIGILAGVMMLFSPDTWIWMTFGGFYAFTLAVPVFVWSLIFFILAFRLKKRFLWVLSLIFYSLTWLFHPMEGVLSTLFLVILAIGLARQQQEGIKMGIIKAGLVIIGGALLIAWWLIPFYIVRQNQGVMSDVVEFIPLKELIGLTPPHDSYITSTFFSAGVAFLFVVGALSSFIRKSIIRYVVICSAIALFLVTCVGFLPQSVLDPIYVFVRATNVRAAVGLRILGPIVAAYGAFSIARLALWLLEKIIKPFSRHHLWKISTEVLSGLAAFFIFAFVVKTIIVIPPYPPNQGYFYQGFGPLYNWLSITKENAQLYSNNIKLFPDFQDVITKVLTGKIQIVDSELFMNKIVTAANKIASLTNKDRVDIPVVGGGILSYALTGAIDVTQIPAVVGIRLITRMAGWQLYCFYLESSCTTIEVEDSSRWFGISTIWAGLSNEMAVIGENHLAKITSSKLYQHEKYTLNVDGKDWGWEVYNFSQATGLASISNKPTILVIGNNPPSNDVFDSVFRGLSQVNFGYDHAWSVPGKMNIDDYELGELQQFNLIILHGYRYHSQTKAWKLLQDYVNLGGNLFVDTGWQYMNPDWGKITKDGNFEEISMPDLLPVSKTIWGNVGKNWDLSLPKSSITEGVGTGKWGSLTWQDQPWGMALSEENWLRDGATALLSDNGKVLVASSTFGRGKVVWTGFDFWGHLVSNRAADETLFVNHVLAYLAPSSSSTFETKLDFTRENPDLISIKLDSYASNTRLLFKEVNTANWQATLNVNGKGSNLRIYSAGPGWKMVFLPRIESDAQLTFGWKKTFIDYLANALSILAVLIIVIYLVGLPKSITKIFKSNIIHNDIERLKKSWQEE